MKTLVLFFALLFSGVAFSAPTTNTPPAAAASETYIVNTIREAIRLPEVLKAEVGTQRILVVFTIEADGTVSVKEVGTANPLVKASLIRQFQGLHFTASGAAEMYSIWLNLSVL